MTERIDAHLHVWRLGRGDYAWPGPDLPILHRDYDLDEARAAVVNAEVDRIILVQATPTLAETEWLLGLAEDDSLVAGVVGWVDLRAAETPETLTRLSRSLHLKGVRVMVQDDPSPDGLDDAALNPSLDMLERLGLTLDLLVRPRHLAAAARLAARRPSLKLVLDHAAKPETSATAFASWSADLADFARAPSAFCKLSGLVTEFGMTDDLVLRPYVDRMLKLFGPRRILWGGDWPVVRLVCEYDAWLGATQRLIQHLDAADRDQIMGGTAVHAYAL